MYRNDIYKAFCNHGFGTPIAYRAAYQRAGGKLRITIDQAGGAVVTLKIEGKLSGRDVSELQRTWQELAPSLGEKRLLVDLRGVLHVDGSGRSLLSDIHAKTGAEFLADTPLTKYFAEQAKNRQKVIMDPNL